MAEIIDLDFYRKFKVALPIRQQEAEKKFSKVSLRRPRKVRKTSHRPIYKNQANIPDKT